VAGVDGSCTEGIKGPENRVTYARQSVATIYERAAVFNLPRTAAVS